MKTKLVFSNLGFHFFQLLVGGGRMVGRERGLKIFEMKKEEERENGSEFAISFVLIGFRSN